MGILRADRLSPTIFLGLGGSGCKAVNMLSGKIRRHPNYPKFKDLIHVVGIDTNKADLHTMKNIPESNRFLVSAFDRRSYVQRKRGKQELAEDKMLTQWVHPDYQFRDAQGAGAGQIRVESRLGIYYNLEEDRAGILRSFKRILDAMSRPDNPFRDNEDRVINVMIYASVAGGTGSGGFLPMAYLLQDLVKEHGWGRPNIVGTLMMPSVFTADVEQALIADINANGYAALKELEYLTKLGYEGSIDQVEFHYNPTNKERIYAHNRPFALTYLIDKPSEISVERYVHAVSDSAFLQLFSPIIGAQLGEYDNYDKHQKSLALGNFSVHYGSFGAAVLVLPRADIIYYSSLRWIGRVLETYLVSGKDDAFRVPYDDPKFQRLARDEQDRIVDDKFNGYVEHVARLEEDQQEKGVYSAIVAQKSTDGATLRQTLTRRFAEMFNTLDEQIQIAPFDPLQVHEGNTSLARPIENLRRDSAASRGKVMSFLDSQIADLKSGRLFSEFFRQNSVGPLAQRYFLIKLKREGFLTPFEDAADGLFLQELKENAFDLDRDHVTREFGDLEKRLRETSKKGFLGSVLSRENKEFDQVRRKTQDWFTQVETGQRDFQKASFWQRYHEELQRAIEIRLSQFRAVSAVSDEVARNVAQEAEKLRIDPAAARGDDSDAGAFYLDSEVMRDDRAGQRLWNRLFAHKLDKSAYYDESKIFDAITAAFAPAVGQDGRVRAKDAMEIVKDLREKLEAQATDTYGRVFEEMGFDLRSALEMEARYVLTPHAKPSDEKAIESVEMRDVQNHIADKLRRVVDQCVLLAAIDKTKRDDPTVVPADVFYVGCAPRYSGDEATSLRQLIKGAASGVDFIDGWGEEDMIVFYRALLGVPIYFFKRVNDELYNSYKTVKAKPNRSYPLHIEAAWEDGIPNLDPKEMREAEEKRRAEESAKKTAGERDTRIWGFVLSTLASSVQKNGEGGYDWVMGSIKKKLAADRAGSFTAFWNLDPSLRDDLVDAGAKLEKEKMASAVGRRSFRGEVETYLANLKEAFAAAYADENEGAVRYLKEEKRVVEEKLAALPAAM